MSVWSDQCKDTAKKLLSETLGLLCCEIDFFVNAGDSNFVYTELTSRIHHRIGECSTLASVLGHDDIVATLQSLHSQMKNAYSGINVDGVFNDIVNLNEKIDAFRRELIESNRVEHPPIDVGNYRTK